MPCLVILNDSPCGTERSYNGLRLALALVRSDHAAVTVFRMGDTAGCAVAGQVTQGHHTLERMLKELASGARRSASAARAWTPAASRLRGSSMEPP